MEHSETYELQHELPPAPANTSVHESETSEESAISANKPAVAVAAERVVSGVFGDSGSFKDMCAESVRPEFALTGRGEQVVCSAVDCMRAKDMSNCVVLVMALFFLLLVGLLLGWHFLVESVSADRCAKGSSCL